MLPLGLPIVRNASPTTQASLGSFLDHATTMALMSNRFLSSQTVENDLALDHVGPTMSIRIDPVDNVALYLWTTEVGGIVTTSLRIGERVVTLAPLIFVVLPDGSRLVTTWKCDEEPNLTFVDVALDGRVYDGELLLVPKTA